jgi:molecular chaperone HtpG
MLDLLKRIEKNSTLTASVVNCENQITQILQLFITNFPEYTDHSIIHSKRVLENATFLLKDEISKLNEDEIYVLIMAGYLHDIGMCPTKDMKNSILKSSSFKNSGKCFEDYLRSIHHDLSYEYILTHWKSLNIVNEIYAEAIALTGRGHRVVDLTDFDQYKPDFAVKSGSDYVCLPYLSGILRLADELDLTSDRIPDLLFNQYFPEDRVSKEEWDKHRANYIINFKKDTIRITSKCFKESLYYALIKQYNKIETMIDEVQKLIRFIPDNERKLRLDYSKLEKDIKTEGFIPKEIGFTFDLQNTINTFIGDNIYKSKDVAIRECLQNAIDTCRYRKKLEKNHYEPQIIIELSDNKLKVIDNGLGMDEYIVENYFAKLAKSYYQENKVAHEFEAISQFGIGVFSYFLICDYFEVESMSSGKEAIFFRVNKDSDNYFHFYDKANRITPGTTISFFLRDKMSIDDLIRHVTHYIRFVEIPIQIYFKERNEIIYSQKITLNKETDLKPRIRPSQIQLINKLEIIDCEISNDEYEGVVGLILTNDGHGTYIPDSLYDVFSSFRNSFIEMSLKGIYVNNIHDFSLNGTIGKINLKKRKDIDLGRYNIINNEYLKTIISDFHYNILHKLFANWQSKHLTEKAHLTKEFIKYCININFSIFNEEVLSLFFDHLFFSVYFKSGISIMKLKEVLQLEEVIILNDNSPYTSGVKYDFEDADVIFNHFGIPLLLENDDNVAASIMRLFEFLDKPIEIVSSLHHWHFIIKKSGPQMAFKQVLNSRNDAFIHDTSHVASFPHLDTSCTFNRKHEIIEYCITNSEVISGHQELNSLFNEFLYLLQDFMFNFHNGGINNPSKKIATMNSILSSINKITSTGFKLSSNDFPSWMNQKIKWDTIN